MMKAIKYVGISNFILNDLFESKSSLQYGMLQNYFFFLNRMLVNLTNKLIIKFAKLNLLEIVLTPTVQSTCLRRKHKIC